MELGNRRKLMNMEILVNYTTTNCHRDYFYLFEYFSQNSKFLTIKPSKQYTTVRVRELRLQLSSTVNYPSFALF